MFTEVNAALKLLRAPSNEQKVEVLLDPRCVGTAVSLRLSTWTDGLGWCAQKTLCLDAAQLEELHRALTVARQRVRRREADSGQPRQPAQVIQFPTLA